jgi:hypothetical protein
MANNKIPTNGIIPGYHMPPSNFSTGRSYFQGMLNPSDSYGRYYPSFINQNVRP